MSKDVLRVPVAFSWLNTSYSTASNILSSARFKSTAGFMIESAGLIDLQQIVHGWQRQVSFGEFLDILLCFQPCWAFCRNSLIKILKFDDVHRTCFQSCLETSFKPDTFKRFISSFMPQISCKSVHSSFTISAQYRALSIFFTTHTHLIKLLIMF